MVTDWELLHGIDAPPAEGRWMHAGPVEALLLEGDLRYVRRGETELARRIQVAVRSADWGTVPGVRSTEQVEQTADSFRVTFDSVHRHGELEFRWTCTIDGGADGTITYTMDGLAERAFPYRRIGLCVLHPTDVFAGAGFEAGSSSARTIGELPASVGPQRFDGETYPPLFDAFDRLQMTARDGVTVQFAFEGDVFEMEDQRNWTDASFKTYSQNPLSRVEPWQLTAGAKLRQTVTIASRGGAPATARPLTVTLGERPVGRVPALGVALGTTRPGPREVELLGELGLSHLRVDLHLGTDFWPAELERGAALAPRPGCGLELAAFARDARELDALALRLDADAGPTIVRLLVYGEDAWVTPVELVEEARSRVGSEIGDAPVGGGSNVYFAELNREAAFPPSFEVLAYPVTPQVHSDDDVSLVETPLAQADTVASARLLAPQASIAVTPITLKPRFNPDAADGDGTPAAPNGLPDNVDARQMALITAAWTLASVRRLGQAGAGSATYFETVGWRGLLESDPPEPRDTAFPAAPGMLFPVYHLLAELAPLSGLELLECNSSHPLELEAIHIAVAGEVRLLVANMTPRAATAELRPIGVDPEIWRLNADTVRRHLFQAGGVRERWNQLAGGDGGVLELELSPFEISVLRWRVFGDTASG
jgi:D-apionolactonase